MARRRRTRGLSTKELALMTLGSFALFGAAWAGMNHIATTEQMDEHACYERPDQAQSVLLADPSFIYDHTKSIEGDIHSIGMKAWRDAGPNTQISFVTFTLHVGRSLIPAVFTICKPPRTAAEQTAIGAPFKEAHLLKAKYEEIEALYELELKRFIGHLRDPKEAAQHTPILEVTRSVSKADYFSNENRTLYWISDGMNNSGEARFCKERGHLPPFSKFQNSSVYRDNRPRLEGAEVYLYLVEHGSLPQPGMEYCTNAELRAFWPAFMYGSGAVDVEIDILATWPGATG